MNNLKLQALSKIDIFQDLSEAEVEEMDRQTTMTTTAPGRVFYAPEETGEVLFLLKKGRVQLYRLSPEGKKLVVAVLEPGAIFGEMSIVGQGMHNTFAESIDECLICVMSRVDVERILKNKPQVAIRFMEAMAQRLEQAEEKMEAFAFRSIPSRLADLLLKLSRLENGRNSVKGFTHQDLAEMLGTYRETTTQTLNEFKERGWIEIGRKKIEILSAEALEEQAAD
ncbi:MAG: Crp/Fnr family transcriptional regulator [Anaerolineales bacterium]